MIVIGTRPEAIKMAPVFLEMARRPHFKPVLLLTGQHRQMARDVLTLFDVVPDIDLEIMRPGQSLCSLAGRLASTLADVLSSSNPDALLVQGDTTSAAIAGMLGFYARCPVGHVEAGLRTGNLYAPYPEEFNRRILTLASRWHFAPTPEAKENLRLEGIESGVFVVGNTVIDAAIDMAARRTPRVEQLIKAFPFLREGGRHILVTTHRRENMGERMASVAAAVKDLADLYPDISFVVPVHPNPEVGAVLRPALTGRANIHVVEPLEYDEALHLIRTAVLVLTDSGGIQEEAPAFDVPVLVLRDETERMEGVVAGCSLLVGTDRGVIVSTVVGLLGDKSKYLGMANSPNPYGDGTASRSIVDILERERG